VRVLVIPEDFTKDQFVLKPIITALMRRLGKPRATVEICFEPRLQGVSEALEWRTIQQIIDELRYRVDLFLLCVDRDGVASRRAALDHIEAQAAARLPSHQRLLAENAWQEIEVWLLAGHDLPADWSWREIRQEFHPKERYFLPFARQRRAHAQPDGGRRVLAEEAARRYDRIRQLCPEDVAALESRIQRWAEENG
jgi:hypothetical protein